MSLISVLDDDVLFHLLTVGVPVQWHAIMARACRRWHDIMCHTWTSQRSRYEAFYADCTLLWNIDKSERATEALFDQIAVGWLARTRYLAFGCRPDTGVTMIHYGHLTHAFVHGYLALSDWIRGMEREVVPCAHGMRSTRSYALDKANRFCFYCPTCSSGPNLLAMRAWTPLLRSGRFDWLAHDLITLDALGSQDAQNRTDAHARYCDYITPHAIRMAIPRVPFNDRGTELEWYVDNGYLNVGTTNTPWWRALGEHARLDLLQWSVKRAEMEPYSKDNRLSLDKHRKAVREVLVHAATGAAQAGSLDVLTWIYSDAHAYATDMRSVIYFQALCSGHRSVLDWLHDRWPYLTDTYDMDPYGNFMGEAPRARHEAPYYALMAPTPSSLCWLGEHGIAIPSNLLSEMDNLERTEFSDDEYLLPGSSETLDYALDVCGCSPTVLEEYLCVAAYSRGLLGVLANLHARRLIPPNGYANIWKRATTVHDVATREWAERCAVETYQLNVADRIGDPYMSLEGAPTECRLYSGALPKLWPWTNVSFDCILWLFGIKGVKLPAQCVPRGMTEPVARARVMLACAGIAYPLPAQFTPREACAATIDDAWASAVIDAAAAACAGKNTTPGVKRRRKCGPAGDPSLVRTHHPIDVAMDTVDIIAPPLLDRRQQRQIRTEVAVRRVARRIQTMCAHVDSARFNSVGINALCQMVMGFRDLASIVGFILSPRNESGS